MAFFKYLQQFHISINKLRKSNIDNLISFLTTVNLISQKSLTIKAKSKIERNYISLLIATCSLTIPMGIVGCSQENKTTQNELSQITTQAKSQSVSNTPQKQEVRVIYSKLGSLAVMRKQGTLEKSLAANNFTVNLLELAAGPQALVDIFKIMNKTILF